MWILFAPSEKKCVHHAKETKPQRNFYENFICKNLDEILKAYAQFLQTEPEVEIQKLFGKKTLNLQELAAAQNLLDSSLLEAINRYVGVAFSALNFDTLNPAEKAYVCEHLLIFSNLFGLLRAGDRIPYYDLKQGEGFKSANLSFNTKQFYAKNLENIWGFLLQNDSTSTKAQDKKSLEFLDLRAGFYQKCFPLNKIPTSFNIGKCLVYEPNFIKNGKVVSHYAKHYRGVLLRVCAKEKLQCLQDLNNLYIEGLELESTQSIQEKHLERVVLTYALNCK